MKLPRLLLTLPFLAASVAPAAESLDLRLAAQGCDCGKHGLFPMPSTPVPGRKYARDRFVDVKHLRLEVTPDFAKRRIAGVVSVTFSPIAERQAEVALDATGFTVASVECTAALDSWQLTGEKLILTFKEPLAPGKDATATIRYEVEPQRGLYFRTPEMGYPAGDTQMWSQGEPEHHRWWFPCFDYPNERLTSEVLCHVPEGMEVISNGKLIAKTGEAGGLTLWHWRQDQPHANYLIALAAGYFHKVEDKTASVPLAVFVPPSQAAMADGAFKDTRKILDFLQAEIGVPFPWDKYWQVYCHDFLAGGMENTSCTFMASGLLYLPETEQLHSLHGIDAHEMTHQWFGDLLTCRDWAHLWLNEGFASFFPLLYEEARDGREASMVRFWSEAQRVINANDKRPMIWRDYSDPFEQFDSRAYPKGAWVLHMLRSQLGTDLFRKCIRTYIDRHRNGIVSSDDFQDVLEEVSGRSFDRFCDQWLYHGGTPELDVRYEWNAGKKQVKLTVKQTQDTADGKVPVFTFPLPVRFSLPDGKSADFAVEISRTSEDFTFALPEKPELVRIDPDLTVLARVKFDPPGDMLEKQLASDVLGRLIAVKSLSGKDDADSVAHLAKVLTTDASHVVRSEAVSGLRKAGTDAARAALLAGLAQPDARVRQDVVQALAAFLQPDARAALDALAATEKNPEILAEIVRSWSVRTGEPAIATALRTHLAARGYEGTVAAAAVKALRGQDDATAVPDILARLSASPQDLDTRSLAGALQDVAFLARNGADREAVYTHLIGRLTDPREDLRLGAVKALGLLGDARATAVLALLRTPRFPGRDPLSEAAGQAITAIESGRTGPPELERLWKELQELRAAQDTLKKDVEKKETEAKEKAKG